MVAEVVSSIVPPVIILVEPTLGENIGAAARAMMNFGLPDMRLVRPKGDWPNPKAINTSSGAERILEQASIFNTTEQAVADLQHLYATTARARDMVKPVIAPRELAKTLHANCVVGEKSGVMFGREAKVYITTTSLFQMGSLWFPSARNIVHLILLNAFYW